jgi:uncharacterized protein YqjF (DUF2071 family)
MRVRADTRDVCFVHTPVDPGVLDTRIPHALDVDTRDGTGWVSLLAMLTRPLAGPVPVGNWTPQVTVRTYVRADGDPAVYFLRIDVDGSVRSLVAQALSGIAFRRVETAVEPGDGRVDVRTHAPDGEPLYDVTVERRGDPAPVADGSPVAWLTDRSRYALSDGRTGEVSHDPWRVAPAAVDVRRDEVLASEGVDAPTGDAVVRYSPGAEFRLTGWP